MHRRSREMTFKSYKILKIYTKQIDFLLILLSLYHKKLYMEGEREKNIYTIFSHESILALPPKNVVILKYEMYYNIKRTKTTVIILTKESLFMFRK